MSMLPYFKNPVEASGPQPFPGGRWLQVSGCYRVDGDIAAIHARREQCCQEISTVIAAIMKRETGSSDGSGVKTYVLKGEWTNETLVTQGRYPPISAREVSLASVEDLTDEQITEGGVVYIDCTFAFEKLTDEVRPDVVCGKLV